jgi:isopentenyl-diphosphate delta-isomerase
MTAAVADADDRPASAQLRRNDTDHVILVDKADHAIGTMAKLEAHRLGRLHRAISVIVRDTRGRLLLHRRAAGKYHSAGLWTNTCCTHPRPGEQCHAAAVRRLNEEMGLAASLSPLASFHYRERVPPRLIEDEYVHIFGGVCEDVPRPDPSEVADWRWMTLAELGRDMDRLPHRYTVWFRRMTRELAAEIADFVAR